MIHVFYMEDLDFYSKLQVTAIFLLQKHLSRLRSAWFKKKDVSVQKEVGLWEQI